jgi:hypothetical protein
MKNAVLVVVTALRDAKYVLIGGLLMAASTAPVCATSISVTNLSFEALSEVPDGFTLNNVPGWTGTPSNFFSTYRPTSTIPGGVPDGLNVAAVANGGSIFQVLVDTLQANTLYTLNVGIGSRNDSLSLAGYAVSLEAGGSVLASDSSQTPAPGTFATSTVTFLAASGNPHLGQALTIRLANTALSGQAQFDFVRLDATQQQTTGAAPEPGSWMLLGMGLLGLTAIRFANTGKHAKTAWVSRLTGLAITCGYEPAPSVPLTLPPFSPTRSSMRVPLPRADSSRSCPRISAAR